MTYVSDCFVVIRDFVRKHLAADPLVLFGDSAWNTFVEVNEVYEKEKQECLEQLQGIDWGNDALTQALEEVTCTECGSGLIGLTEPTKDRVDALFACRSCAQQWGVEDMAEKAMEKFYGYENSKNVADGGDPASIQCPECGRYTYLIEDNVCCVCDWSVERECQRCEITIPVEELDGSGFCGWCKHQMARDD